MLKTIKCFAYAHFSLRSLSTVVSLASRKLRLVLLLSLLTVTAAACKEEAGAGVPNTAGGTIQFGAQPTHSVFDPLACCGWVIGILVVAFVIWLLFFRKKGQSAS